MKPYLARIVPARTVCANQSARAHRVKQLVWRRRNFPLIVLPRFFTQDSEGNRGSSRGGGVVKNSNVSFTGSRNRCGGKEYRGRYTSSIRPRKGCGRQGGTRGPSRIGDSHPRGGRCRLG